MSKEKIKSSMLEHLKTKGFPKMSYDQIQAECPAMWKKLEEENLIQPGMMYINFVFHAGEQRRAQSISDALSAWFT